MGKKPVGQGFLTSMCDKASMEKNPQQQGQSRKRAQQISAT